MKISSLVVFAMISASALNMAQAQSINCDKQVESYLLNIGDLDSNSFEVVEIQAGNSVYNKNSQLEYNESNYRLSGALKSVSVKLVVDAETCLLKKAQVKR